MGDLLEYGRQRVVVITGADRGLGLALVQEYLNHGIEIPYQTVTVKSREAGEGGESRNNKGFDEEQASEQENQI